MTNRILVLLMTLTIASMAQARIRVPPPQDPYASLNSGEYIDAFDHGHAGHFIEQAVKHAISENLSFDQQVAAVEAATKKMVAHYASEEHMTPLSLMNSLLFELATQYRHHGPLSEMKSQWIDSASEKEIRQLAVEAAGAVMGAIANLPNESYEIVPEFSQQYSKTTPLEVLKSYVNDPKIRTHEPFFANEHASMLEAQIRRAKANTGLFARWTYRLSGQRKSCLAAFGVKIPANER